MANIIHWLLPKEEKFFDMLKMQSENALEGAKELKVFVEKYSALDKGGRKAYVQKIESLEHKGDEITHDIINKLNKTFITPIDKEDIHRMVVLLDDIIDLIDVVALRFTLLKIEKMDDHIIKLAELLLNAVEEVNKNTSELRKLRHTKEQYIKIQSIENEADDVHHNAILELFSYHSDPIHIIKYKEIYELLEKTIDKCEETTHIMESVVVKHA